MGILVQVFKAFLIGWAAKTALNAPGPNDTPQRRYHYAPQNWDMLFY